MQTGQGRAMGEAYRYEGLFHRDLSAAQRWSKQITEDVIDPDLRIVDPHHHLWYDAWRGRYLAEEMLADMFDGHAVTKTVCVQGMAPYRREGPELESSLGETELITHMAELSVHASQGKRAVAAGIVAFVDLTSAALNDDLFRRHSLASGGRLRGIRHCSNFDPSNIDENGPSFPEGLLLSKEFRRGFALLARNGLTFDAFLYHPQLADLVSLARDFPETTIVLDHLGTPLGVGPYTGRSEEVFVTWKAMLAKAAECPNVVVKLGGLGMLTAGFDFHLSLWPPTSSILADAWRPYIETAIELFGTRRAMFESNFPVDLQSTSYRNLWNAYKRISSGFSNSERKDLFCGNSERIYRI